VNKESGLIAVKATHQVHREIQNFLDLVLLNSKRQVLIEATIAEVQLGDNYQAGVDWSSVQTSVSGITLNQSNIGDNLAQPPVFTLSATNNSLSNPLRLTLKALEEFGEVKVISSPKIMMINNQTALLKVVDNIVYFTIDVDVTEATDTSPRSFVYETEVHTVPVGFVMSVTSYINESNNITLNVRPTITRQIGEATDPNPALADRDIINTIPIIQVREVESILKVNDGDTAILGGLMQNENIQKSSGIPYLSGIPMLGSAFSLKDDSYKKSELIIFIKTTVIKNASIEKDLLDMKLYLPSDSNPDQQLPPVSPHWQTSLKELDKTAEKIDVEETHSYGVE